MSDGPVRVERDGAVAIVVLDDPPLNLFRQATFEGLRAARDEIAASDARACVFRAEGDVFTGGVDVSEFAAISDPEGARQIVRQGIDDLRSLEALEIPTLALVQGLCLTAGFEASLGCDMIWAADGAAFGLVERVVGLTPFGGGLQRVAERAGPARARELVMTGRTYPAGTMLDWGVINRVLGADELDEKGMAFAAELASGPTVAHALTKRIVRAYLNGGIEAADQLTADQAPALFETEDLQNAVQSFLEEGPGKATFEGK